jgi:phage gp29-like protein
MKLFSRRKKEKEIAPAIARTAVSAYGWPPFGSGNISAETYEEMLSDPLVRSALTVKKLGALAVPWKIVPASDSPASKLKADFVSYSFAEMEGSATGILFDAMDALAKGHAVLEKIFVADAGEFRGLVRLHSAKPKDPALFGFDVDEFLNVLNLILHVPGSAQKSLPVQKFIVFAHGRRYGRPTGEPDLRAAHRHWAIKREMIIQWSVHLEKFASPTVLGKFKRGMSEDGQLALLDALDKLQRQSAAVYPDDVDISLLDRAREAQSSYLEAIDYHNREIARAILGQTLTTEDSQRVGSLALGKVHLQVLMMQLAGLRRDLADRVMNEQVIRPLIDMNFGPGGYPVFQFEEPELDVFRTGKVV